MFQEFEVVLIGAFCLKIRPVFDKLWYLKFERYWPFFVVSTEDLFFTQEMSKTSLTLFWSEGSPLKFWNYTLSRETNFWVVVEQKLISVSMC